MRNLSHKRETATLATKNNYGAEENGCSAGIKKTLYALEMIFGERRAFSLCSGLSCVEILYFLGTLGLLEALDGVDFLETLGFYLGTSGVGRLGTESTASCSEGLGTAFAVDGGADDTAGIACTFAAGVEAAEADVL